MTEIERGPVLVTTATGKTGRRVAERLAAKGVDVREGSRGAEPRFDWEDADTWGPALAGMRSAYVAFSPDLAVPGAPGAIERFVAEARAAGVERLVLLSGRGEEEAQSSERLVAASGLYWTVVRASWFSQNFSEGDFRSQLLDGALALPVGGVREPFVDADDIADVAVAALTEDGHAGEIYEVTGPRLMTFAEAVAEIAKASGRELAFVPITSEQLQEALAAEGVPVEAIELLAYLFGEVLDGRNESVTDGVQRALGREPRDFADFARAAAGAGIWDV